jgi:hypothetical protein
VRLAEECEESGAGQGYLDLPPEVVRAILRTAPNKAAGSAAG